tara:strand:- start:3151 stop:4449 length:1299 start_codon:yes stop_codon:yes gene_type:complete
MKEITNILIETIGLGAGQSSRRYTVTGDPGATFSLIVTNEDGHYYNFPENTIVINPETETQPIGAFSSTPARLNPTTLNNSGSYSGNIVFPAVTDDDYYNITFTAEKHYNTKIADSFSKDDVYYVPKIHQYLDTTVTFSLSSAGSSGSYNSMPSDYTPSGSDVKSGEITSPQTISVSWPVTLSASNFVIAKQPKMKDFEFTTTKTTKTAGSSSTELELTDVKGLSVGMGVSGTGIASDSVITEIHRGYKDQTNSTSSIPIYIIPKVASDNGKSIVNSTGGTVIIDKASTFVVDRTITFTGKGSNASEIFNETIFEISDFALTIDPVTTTTDAAMSGNSVTVPLTSTDGIKAADTVLMTGIGVIGTPHVDSVSSGASVNVSVTQTALSIENGQTLTFTGSSRSATITGNIKILQYGNSNITLTLALDNILTVE